MARRGFKRFWTRLVPKPIERSSYVLCACLCLVLLFRFWQPMPEVVWSVDQPFLRLALNAAFWSGWTIVLVAALLTNSLELVGLRQIWDWCVGREDSVPTLTTSGLYRFVRHPIYFGSLIGFWATPDMTVGHLFFSVSATLYTVVGAILEERDLVNTFGDRYRVLSTQGPHAAARAEIADGRNAQCICPAASATDGAGPYDARDSRGPPPQRARNVASSSLRNRTLGWAAARPQPRSDQLPRFDPADFGRQLRELPSPCGYPSNIGPDHWRRSAAQRGSTLARATEHCRSCTG